MNSITLNTRNHRDLNGIEREKVSNKKILNKMGINHKLSINKIKWNLKKLLTNKKS